MTSADWRVRSLSIPRGFGLLSRLVFGITKPRQPILGAEFAGEVESVGKNAHRFKVGERVFGMTGAGMACYAQYRCLPETAAISLIPSGIGYEDAAALPFGGTTALDFFRRAKFERGETILINGASGAVGTAMLQLAKHFGADVTAVCSTSNLELVKSLGADHVIDYTQQDFTQLGERYDVIADTVGSLSLSQMTPCLKEKGRLLLVVGSLSDTLSALWVSMFGTRKVIVGPAAEREADLALLAKLVQEGRYRPVIDRRYSLAQIVDAHRYVDTRRKKGSVVVTVEHPG